MCVHSVWERCRLTEGLFGKTEILLKMFISNTVQWHTRNFGTVLNRGSDEQEDKRPAVWSVSPPALWSHLTAILLALALLLQVRGTQEGTEGASALLGNCGFLPTTHAPQTEYTVVFPEHLITGTAGLSLGQRVLQHRSRTVAIGCRRAAERLQPGSAGLRTEPWTGAAAAAHN